MDRYFFGNSLYGKVKYFGNKFNVFLLSNMALLMIVKNYNKQGKH